MHHAWEELDGRHRSCNLCHCWRKERPHNLVEAARRRTWAVRVVVVECVDDE